MYVIPRSPRHMNLKSFYCLCKGGNGCGTSHSLRQDKKATLGNKTCIFSLFCSTCGGWFKVKADDRRSTVSFWFTTSLLLYLYLCRLISSISPPILWPAHLASFNNVRDSSKSAACASSFLSVTDCWALHIPLDIWLSQPRSLKWVTVGKETCVRALGIKEKPNQKHN